MQFQVSPYVNTTNNTVALQANVQAVVNAINANAIIPLGDYGGDKLYYFTPMNNGLGNIIYTIFDRETTMGLSSFMVRYGSAATIQQILFEPFPRSQIHLQYIILPKVHFNLPPAGDVIP